MEELLEGAGSLGFSPQPAPALHPCTHSLAEAKAKQRRRPWMVQADARWRCHASLCLKSFCFSGAVSRRPSSLWKTVDRWPMRPPPPFTFQVSQCQALFIKDPADKRRCQRANLCAHLSPLIDPSPPWGVRVFLERRPRSEVSIQALTPLLSKFIIV